MPEHEKCIPTLPSARTDVTGNGSANAEGEKMRRLETHTTAATVILFLCVAVVPAGARAPNVGRPVAGWCDASYG